jgi:hypothetical protein
VPLAETRRLVDIANARYYARQHGWQVAVNNRKNHFTEKHLLNVGAFCFQLLQLVQQVHMLFVR